MDTTLTREASLDRFDKARDAFVEKLATAPADALDYLKPDDDYALGGLAFHVNAVLEHYHTALEAMRASGFAETTPTDRPGLMDQANARAKEGTSPAERDAELATTRRLHDQVRASAAGLSTEDFARKAPVRFSADAELYPTSAGDVLGWLTDHYFEHVPHIDQLLVAWKESR